MVEKVSVRQICRDYGLSHHTVAKMLENVEPPGYQQGEVERPRPKLGPFLGVIDQILEGDQMAPKKQRHTAKRIFERLRDEHGYQGSESQVRRYLAENDHRHREVFVPLAQPPGEAQFDFGEALVEIAGVRMKAALAVMSLPYSDAFHVTAYPRECTETFQAAHDTSFEFFGGVPTKIAYDNTTVAVKKVLEGPNRELTSEFLRLESHFLFTHRFCRVARGNEKGHVESLVGYHRRNFLVPVPSFASFAAVSYTHLREIPMTIVRDSFYINGEWVKARSSETIEVTTSGTGEVFATVPAGTVEEANLAENQVDTTPHKWAVYIRDTVIPAMDDVRDVADRLEKVVADDLWPLPKYSEMLFIK